MSTVNKATADRVIAGEFPEDNCVAIIRYENIFNGDFAYKLVFHKGEIPYLMNNPNMDCPTIYWEK